MAKKQNINPFKFIELAKNGQKIFKNKNDFKEFLNLDFDIKDNIGNTAITPILNHNKKFDLKPKQIMQICQKLNANIYNIYGGSYIHFILSFNKETKINLNNQQISDLIKKIDLTHLLKNGKSYFYYILNFNHIENLGFSNEQLYELYNKTILAFEQKYMIKEKKDFIHSIKTEFPHFISTYTAFSEKNTLSISPPVQNKDLIKRKL